MDDLPPRTDAAAPTPAWETVVDDPVAHLHADDPAVRRIAVASVAQHIAGDDLVPTLGAVLLHDESAVVRAEAAEALGGTDGDAMPFLLQAVDDPDERVVEAVATAFGELADERATDWLLDAAQTHADRLVREAAVVALGSIGDPSVLPVLLDLVVSAPPQVRRRTVVALTAFDDPAVGDALRKATEDRNPMVREVAEMTVGRRPEEGWEPIELR